MLNVSHASFSDILNLVRDKMHSHSLASLHQRQRVLVRPDAARLHVVKEPGERLGTAGILLPWGYPGEVGRGGPAGEMLHVRQVAMGREVIRTPPHPDALLAGQDVRVNLMSYLGRKAREEERLALVRDAGLSQHRAHVQESLRWRRVLGKGFQLVLVGDAEETKSPPAHPLKQRLARPHGHDVRRAPSDDALIWRIPNAPKLLHCPSASTELRLGFGREKWFKAIDSE